MIAKYKNEVFTIFGTVIYAAFAVGFWSTFLGQPFDELALIRRAETIPGEIADVWEDPEDGEEGQTIWTNGATYTYRLTDGREFTGYHSGHSRLREELRDLKQPYSVEVEYLPDNPQVSRVKGSGCKTVFEWLWRKVGLGLLLLAMFLFPAVPLFTNAMRNILRIRRGLSPIALEV